MNQKVVLILIIVIAVMGAVAMFVAKDDPSANGPAALFPGINIAELDQIEMKSQGNTVTLALEDSQWRVQEKAGYPADTGDLSELVNQLGKAKLLEKKTSKPENFATLGVDDIEQDDSEAPQVPDSKASQVDGSEATQVPGSEAILVTLTVGDEQYAVLVGDTSSSRRGSYIRKPGDNQVWLIDKSLVIDKESSDWVEPVIIDVEAEDVSDVRISTAGNELTFLRGEDGEFSFQEMPDDRKLKYPTIVNEPARALVKVRLEDVVLHDPERWQGPNRALFTLKNGTVVTVQGVIEEVAEGDGTEEEGAEEEVEKNHWIHFGVSPSESDTTEYGDLSAWDYKVTSYIFDDFVKTMEDVLAEETSEDEVETATEQ